MLRLLVGSAFLFQVSAVGALAQTHPLDGLSASEYSRVIEILEAGGKLSETGRLPLIELREPDKAAVRAWKPGKPGQAIPRQVSVVLKDGPATFAGEIDLTAGKLLAWHAASGESMVQLDEFLGAMELALGAPEMVAGLEKRGLTPDGVFCLPLTAGSFDAEAEKGQRLMKVPCYVNPTGSNFYAKPVEGLFAVVDLNGQQVVEVIDTGVVPVAKDPWGYTQEELEKRLGGLRPRAKPVGLAAPKGDNITIKGSLVSWDMWRFRYRVDKRPGVVLSLIEANDSGKWRSVLYQAHLSEVFVPYMDPDQGWYWRTYMDSGEYGFGVFLSPLRPGVDCPAHARFLDVTLSTDTGEPFAIPGALCVFERQIGDPAWRHFEIFAQSPEVATPAEGRAATELVFRSASEVGNYDYLVDYVFQQDGTIRIAVGSTGLDAVKGVKAMSMADASAEADTRYGTLIAPNLVAPNHDHYFNFRLDFDIDGEVNDFMRARLVPAVAPEGLPRRSFWTVQREHPKTEGAARSKINPATPAMYHIVNTTVESALGHHPSYVLKPGGSFAYGQLSLDDPPVARNAYIENQFWVTPYDAKQRYAGGAFAFQSSGDDTLMTWTNKDRPITNRDIVAWYTVGFHHVPRMEDWPVMPLHWSGFRLMPFNFFAHNPAISIRGPK
jgi:primary-amine oxidase